MIYTSYINSPLMKSILNSDYKSKGIEVFTIMRYPSPWFKRYYPNVKNLINLSPFPFLKYSYDKGEISYEDFCKTYKKQIEEDSNKPLIEVKGYENKHKIIILCCCEKNDNTCHRKALRDFLPNSKELNEKDFETIFTSIK